MAIERLLSAGVSRIHRITVPAIFTQAASGPLATVSEIEDFYHRLTDYAVGFNRTPKYGHAHVTKFFSKLSVIVNMYQI